MNKKLSDIVNKHPKLYLLVAAVILFPIELFCGLFSALMYLAAGLPGEPTTVGEYLSALIALLINFAPSMLLTTLWILRKTNRKYLNVLTIFSLLIFAFFNITFFFFPKYFWHLFGFFKFLT